MPELVDTFIAGYLASHPGATVVDALERWNHPAKEPPAPGTPPLGMLDGQELVYDVRPYSPYHSVFRRYGNFQGQAVVATNRIEILEAPK